MKTLSILLLSLALTSFSTGKPFNKLESSETKVLVCTGKYAKKYHNHECRGIKACKADIISISLSQAKDRGYKPCGYCY